MNDPEIIPKPVLQRLPKYLSHAQVLEADGSEWVSSHALARSLGLTSSTVRQDLSHLDLKGVSKRGYETAQMVEVLREVLGADRSHRLVIVGAGYLGTALALHGGFAAYGFEPCGIFDADNKAVGTKVGSLTVKPMSQLTALVRRKQVEIGLIAVPADAAQEVADKLVRAGVTGLLNLAYRHVSVPPRVSLIDARLLASLQMLAYHLRHQSEASDEEEEDPTKAGNR